MGTTWKERSDINKKRKGTDRKGKARKRAGKEHKNERTLNGMTGKRKKRTRI